MAEPVARRRPLAVLALMFGLVGGALAFPGSAYAAVYTTTLTCTSPSVCGAATTDPTPPGGVSVTASLFHGSVPAQVFEVVPAGGAAVTSVVGTRSGGGSASPVDSSGNLHTFTLNDDYIAELVVTWNDDATTTTSSTSTSSTSSTSTSSTSSTSTTTTSTTLPARGPGHGPNEIQPDARAGSSPSAASVRGHNRLDVVVRDGDHIYWTREDFPGTPWTVYQNLTGPPGGAQGTPAIASWGPGRLDVFVQGNDDKLWQKFSDDGGANWSAWLRPFPLVSGAGLDDEGKLTASPTLSTRGVNRLNVFVVNVDGDVYERFYDGPQVGWNSGWIFHGKPSGGLHGTEEVRSDPSAVAWGGSDRLDLFVRGADNQLWRKFYDGTGWTGWNKPLEGKAFGYAAGNPATHRPMTPAVTLDSAPAVTSWEPGNLLVFVKGSDDRVYAVAFGTGGWGDWVFIARQTDRWTEAPGATSRGVGPLVGRFDVFLAGTDDRTYHVWQ